MEKYQYIDRFFYSQHELLDITKTEKRDFNTLYTFLNCLHTTGDKLKEDFGCDIKIYPEFKLLRIIRNYFHHIGDVEEIRLKVHAKHNVLISHSEHLIIPLETFAKSVKSFIENNTNKKKFVDSEMAAISEIFDYTADLLANLNLLCDKPSLKLDGIDYELGFDMFKFIFNITNIVADKCREIDLLKEKNVVIELDWSYTVKNNIRKFDVFAHPNQVPITTTEGFVYPSSIGSVK